MSKHNEQMRAAVEKRLKKDEVFKRRVLCLGVRAIDYYIDTGLCVFCDADDCASMPHKEHCEVGKLSGVNVDVKRRKQKQEERDLVNQFFLKPSWSTSS